MMFDRDIRQAISERHLVEFHYHGAARVAEPHVYGLHDGKYQLLCFQVGGQSRSGKLPNWRRFDLDEMTGLRVLSESFPGPRDFSAFRSSSFDTVLAVVR